MIVSVSQCLVEVTKPDSRMLFAPSIISKIMHTVAQFKTYSTSYFLCHHCENDNTAHAGSGGMHTIALRQPHNISKKSARLHQTTDSTVLAIDHFGDCLPLKLYKSTLGHFIRVGLKMCCESRKSQVQSTAVPVFVALLQFPLPRLHYMSIKDSVSSLYTFFIRCRCCTQFNTNINISFPGTFYPHWYFWYLQSPVPLPISSQTPDSVHTACSHSSLRCQPSSYEISQTLH